jgi:hypothetical protein
VKIIYVHLAVSFCDHPHHSNNFVPGNSWPGCLQNQLALPLLWEVLAKQFLWADILLIWTHKMMYYKIACTFGHIASLSVHYFSNKDLLCFLILLCASYLQETLYSTNQLTSTPYLALLVTRKTVCLICTSPFVQSINKWQKKKVIVFLKDHFTYNHFKFLMKTSLDFNKTTLCFLGDPCHITLWNYKGEFIRTGNFKI